jgi:chromosome segregation ATPase
MIEPVMFVGIGFLVASLLVIGVIPLVHARAVRLTMKRLEALTPMSMAEIQAEKDQLRAEFAMSTRRLEMSVEQMKAKTTSQLAEIGKRSEAVGRLKLELSEKTAAMFALEAKERQLAEELSEVQAELAARTAALAQAEQALAEARAKVGDLTVNLSDGAVTSDSQRVELVALRAQVEVLTGQIETMDKEIRELNERLDLKTSEVETSQRQLVDERGGSDALGNRIHELERQLIAQTTESEILERRVQELLARVDEQGRLLGERDYVTNQLRTDAATAAKKEADARTEFTEADSRNRTTIEMLRSEKVLLESQLRQAHDDRSKLERELETMRREAEAAGAAERTQNALMRERITDVAAEMARLTSLLEGPGNPIEKILAGDGRTHAPLTGAAGGNGANGELGKGSLADRIRALQSRAARVPPPSGA